MKKKKIMDFEDIVFNTSFLFYHVSAEQRYLSNVDFHIFTSEIWEYSYFFAV